MMTENNYAQLAASLNESLHLRQPPISISFTDVAPKDVKGHAGRVSAGCRFWEDAATASFVTSAVDHSLCAVGVYTHHLEPSPQQQTDLVDTLKVLGELEYVREEDLASIPVLASQPKYVVYSPLSATPLPPDVVMLFVNADQSLILTEATQQVEHQTPPAMGRPACAVVPQVMNTGRAAMSLGCCGARAYLDVLTDGVAQFAIPGAKLAEYVARIEVLAKANAVLSRFHHLRRADVEAGRTPTVKESLVALGA
jgi:uncharacterized protein (DUF169 family)